MLIVCAYGQYSTDVESYVLYWNKINKNTDVSYFEVVRDTTLSFGWERGDVGDTTAYVPLYGLNIQYTMVFPNDSSMWNVDTAVVSRDLQISNGLYELIVTEKDIWEYESGYSNPLYIYIRKKFVRVQINLRVEE